MNYELENDVDLMVARVRAELGIAKGIVDEAREAQDYYQEKVALKLTDFLETEAKLVKLYAEAKLYYKPVADMLEERRPYLREMYAQAQSDWDKIQKARAREGRDEQDSQDPDGSAAPGELPSFHI